MTYSYDSGTKKISKSGKHVGWALSLAAATAIIALMIGILSNDPALTTFFSSILSPPAGVTWWEKNVYRNDGQVGDEWWSGSIAVTNTTTLAIADRITTTAAFTLTETWDTGVLLFTGYISETGGTVISSTGMLTWTVPAPVMTTTQYVIIKSWQVITSSFTTARVTETLDTAGGAARTAVIIFAPGIVPTPTPTPTPTNTPTPTPRPTFTPKYTPRPWAETPFPTATPCVGIWCGGGPEIAYILYFPVILRGE